MNYNKLMLRYILLVRICTTLINMTIFGVIFINYNYLHVKLIKFSLLFIKTRTKRGKKKVANNPDKTLILNPGLKANLTAM